MSGIVSIARLVCLVACPFLQPPTPTAGDPPAVLTGTVLREDGTPVVGATVRCLRTSHPMFRGGCGMGPDWASVQPCSIDRTATDERGQFRFEFPEGIELGRVEVMPTADTGLALVTWRDQFERDLVDLKPGESVDGIVRAPRPTRLSGTVVDESGVAVPGARVLVWHAGRPRDINFSPIPPDAFVLADAHGNFVVPATGHLTLLEAEADGMVGDDRLMVSGDPGLTRDGLRLSLRQAARVDGVILDPNGAPLADARIFAQRSSSEGEWQFAGDAGVQRSTSFSLASRTDASGHFTLSPLPHDTLQLIVAIPPWLPWFRTLVPEGQSLRVELDAGATLTGTVRSADGQPLRGAILETTANGGSRQLTDAQGAFGFVGVPPSTYGWLSVQAEGHVPRVLEGLAIVTDRDNTLDVRLDRELCISGCVIKADGQALANAAVDIRDDGLLPGQDMWSRQVIGQALPLLTGDQRLGFATTYTDDGGHFCFRQLPARHFQLRVGERPQLFSVLSGEESLVLQLARPEDWRRRLLGTVVDAETGQSIDDFEVSGQYDCTGPVPPDPPQKHGNRFIFDLFTSSVHLTIAAPDHEYWFATFDGEEGRDYEQVIRLQPARRVAVSVVDEHGKAVPSCDVSVSCRGQPVKFAAKGCRCRGSAKMGREGRVVVERLPRDTVTISILRRTASGGRECAAEREVDLSANDAVNELEFVVTTAQ